MLQSLRNSLIALVIMVFAPASSVFAYSIINAHEHIQNFKQIRKLIPIMNRFKIETIAIVGSPEQTFFPKTFAGVKFTKYDKNNTELLKIAKKFPKRFILFCVGHQDDPQILEKIKDCLSKGGIGVKLFSGHGSFHTIPLNSPLLEVFYAHLEDNQIPIIWHVNSGLYQSEFEAVLQKFPNLKIICPHFCMASKTLTRLTYLLDRYPNLYTDTSFGGFVEEGFKTVSENAAKFRELVFKYQNRILMGTDFVITTAKTPERIKENFSAYINQLKRDKFSYLGKEYHGLALPAEVLERIFEENWDKIPNSNDQ